MGCAFAGCVGVVAQKRRGGSVPAKITMSLAKKITLENAIFFRAACLRAPVDGVRGELCSPSDDVCLQVLLSVYNAFFGAENAAFLAESGEAPTANFRSFLAQRPSLNGCVVTGVPFFEKDFAAELMYLCGQIGPV